MRFFVGIAIATCFLVCATVCIADQIAITDDGRKIRLNDENMTWEWVKPSKEIVTPSDDAKMILIPKGVFQMGDNYGFENEKPAHNVYLDAFYMDKYEVTNSQYKKFLEATGYEKTPKYWLNVEFNAPNLPVVGVSWHDAKAYAKWAGKRLPTEAEWEKAARSGLENKRYPWGDEINHGRANYEGTGLIDKWEKTSPVSMFGPNDYGIYNMAGNVRECCEDWYNKDYYKESPEKNPKGPDSGEYRILRGGDWNSDPKYPLRNDLRVAMRGTEKPDYTDYRAGFRCAISLKEAPKIQDSKSLLPTPYNKVEIGMSVDQLKAICGEPAADSHSIDRPYDNAILSYTTDEYTISFHILLGKVNKITKREIEKNEDGSTIICIPKVQ